MHVGELEEKEGEFIGLIPAAGYARRLSHLSCSKEVIPVRGDSATQGGARSQKVVSEFLLEKFVNANVTRALIILRKGKWDIPQYFGDGSKFGIELGYLMMGNPNGVPFTLDQAFSFVGNMKVAFGFPDILFPEQDAFTSLIQRQEESGADMVLGLFPCGVAPQADCVVLSDDGKVQQIISQSSPTSILPTWGIAVWTSQFTRFLHEYLVPYKGVEKLEIELSINEVIQAGLEHGLRVLGLTISPEPFLDIGTPEGLAQATPIK